MGKYALKSSPERFLPTLVLAIVLNSYSAEIPQIDLYCFPLSFILGLIAFLFWAFGASSDYWLYVFLSSISIGSYKFLSKHSFSLARILIYRIDFHSIQEIILCPVMSSLTHALFISVLFISQYCQISQMFSWCWFWNNSIAVLL